MSCDSSTKHANHFLRPTIKNAESKGREHRLSYAELDPALGPHCKKNLDSGASSKEHKVLRYLENMIFTQKPRELGLFSLKEMTLGQLYNSLPMHKELLWKETVNALSMFAGKNGRKKTLIVYNDDLRHNQENFLIGRKGEC